jgi:GTP-binding protein HflX
MLPRAILIDIIPPQMKQPEAKRRLYELECLVNTYGGIVIVKIIQRRSVPDYKTYIGSGKLKEVIETAKRDKADIIIINNLLKPKQMLAIGDIVRHAGALCGQAQDRPLQVWDRIDLILKIFQKHATTAEAKLQIKLAAIRHMGPRIFGMGMEMSQQAGGIGTRGIGETNIEIMKRHLALQTSQVEKKLEDASRSRGEHRKRRDRLGLKTVSIVGYTNSGKSSLLNALTHKGAYVANKLFATLDTRVAKLWLADNQEILLSDTIGFIQDLPPELISAFRSTLEETVEADLLLHVVDASDQYWHQQAQEVEKILEQLGLAATPKIYVFNKIDLVPRDQRTNVWAQHLDKLINAKSKEQNAKNTPVRFVSCLTGEGLDKLKDILRSSF